MVKKTTMLALTICALLTAAPATVSATELIEGGNPLEVGSIVRLTSTNVEVTTAVGALHCELIAEVAEVEENGPAVGLDALFVEIEGCGLTSPPVAVKITDLSFGFFEFEEGVGLSESIYKVDIPAAGLVDCHLKGLAHYTYEPGSNVVSVAGSELTPGIKVPPGCPQQGIIHGSYSLETVNGAAVQLE